MDKSQNPAGRSAELPRGLKLQRFGLPVGFFDVTETLEHREAIEVVGIAFSAEMKLC